MKYDLEEMSESDFHIDISGIQTEHRVHSISIGGSIISSPIIADKLLIFGSNDTYVYALDQDGNKVWNYKTNGIIMSSPTFHEDTIVIGSADGFVYALSTSGDLKWRFLTGGKVWSTPTIVGGVVYITSNSGFLHSLSLEDGKEIWRYSIPNQEFFSSPSAANGSLVFGNFNRGLYSISTEGSLLWKLDCGDSATSPLIVEKNNREISSFRSRSFSIMPEIHNGKIFFGAGDSFYCIDACSRKIEWNIFVSKMGGSSPALHDNNVYFGSFDGKLYAVNTDGRVRWKFQAGNRIGSTPVFDRDSVYFGSSDCNLYSLDCKNGSVYGVSSLMAK